MLDDKIKKIWGVIDKVIDSGLLKQYIYNLILQVNDSEFSNSDCVNESDFVIKNLKGDCVYIYVKNDNIYVYSSLGSHNIGHLYYNILKDGSKTVFYEAVKIIEQENGCKLFEEIEDSYFYDINGKFIKHICNIERSLCDNFGIICSDSKENNSTKIEDYLVGNEIYRRRSTFYKYFPDSDVVVCSSCDYQPGIYGSENSSQLVEPEYVFYCFGEKELQMRKKML